MDCLSSVWGAFVFFFLVEVVAVVDGVVEDEVVEDDTEMSSSRQPAEWVTVDGSIPACLYAKIRKHT